MFLLLNFLVSCVLVSFRLLRFIADKDMFYSGTHFVVYRTRLRMPELINSLSSQWVQVAVCNFESFFFNFCCSLIPVPIQPTLLISFTLGCEHTNMPNTENTVMHSLRLKTRVNSFGANHREIIEDLL